MEDNQKDTEATGKSLGKDVSLYIEKRIQLMTITIAEQTSLIVAQSVQKLLGLFILSSALLFVWIGFSFLLGDLVQSTALGFVLASLPLFLFGGLFARSKSKSLTERIQVEIITKVMEGVEESLRLTLKENKDQEETSGEK